MERFRYSTPPSENISLNMLVRGLFTSTYPLREKSSDASGFKGYLTAGYRCTGKKPWDFAAMHPFLNPISRTSLLSLNQIYSRETCRFFVDWMEFCVSIPKPTRGLLVDLQNTDLATAYACRMHFTPLGSPTWHELFGRELLSWLKNCADGSHKKVTDESEEVSVSGSSSLCVDQVSIHSPLDSFMDIH